MPKITQATSELLASREPFFTTVDIDTTDINCGDERPGGPEPYIHVFGGALNTPYNFAVLREVLQPGSVKGAFQSEVAGLTPVLLKTAGLRYGVHSDDHNESGATISVQRHEGGVGCGYGGKRQPISLLIAERRDEILQRATGLLPEFFASQDDEQFAAQVFEAHARLSANEAFFAGGGRAAVLAAMERGAHGMIVRGEHLAKDGIINLSPGSTILNSRALAADLPTYDHDAWATETTYDRLAELYPFEKRQLQLAEHLDTIGTMLALGVEDIVVRRAA